MSFFINFGFILLETEEHKGGLLDVNPGLIFWTAITVLFLVLILKKVAWKPILGALDAREKFIKESLEKSETARAEAEILLKENKANLARAEEDAQKIIEQGREFAEKLKTQIINESKNEARKIIDDAGAEIKRKNEEAFIELKTQVALIAIQAAEKILRENLDKEKQINITNKFIDELPKN
jgi:F-type H+-transporting ATPase subunit b